MSILTSSPTASVNDEQVRAVAQAVLRTFQLSAQKAALNHADPARFPIKKGAASAESVIAPLFKQLPPPKQQAAKTRALAAVGAPVAASSGVGLAGQRAASAAEFAGVDFQSPVPVSEQLLASAGAKAAAPAAARAGRLPGGLDFGWPRPIIEGGEWPRRGEGRDWPPKVEDRGGNGGKGGATLPLKRAVLVLHSMKAVKDTKEWGKDEIYLGATAVAVTTVNGAAVTSKEMTVDAFKLGSFKKGETKLLGDKVLYAFSLPEPAKYPVSYVITLQALEKDHGSRENIRKVLKGIEDAVRKEIEKWIKKIPGDVGKIVQFVAKVLPTVLAAVFDAIARWLGDDFLDPKTITISMTSPADRLPGSNFTPRETVPLLMKGGDNGRFDLTYSWQVFA